VLTPEGCRSGRPGLSPDYDSPQPVHIHTVLHTPHGNDYGRAYVRQWQEQNAAG
jgi:hypothetical protein